MKCPYCAEEIQQSAKKCRFCGEWLGKKSLKQINIKYNKDDKKIKKDNNEILQDKKKRNLLIYYKIEVFSFILCYIIISFTIKASSTIIFGQILGYIIIYFFIASIIYELLFRIFTKNYHKFNITLGLIIYFLLSIGLIISAKNHIDNNNVLYDTNLEYAQYLSQKTIKDIFYNELKKSEDSLNEGLPYMINDNVRLDKVLVPGNNSIQYNYTYVNLSKLEMDINKSITSLKSEITNGIINSLDLKEYRDNNITFIYVYKDKNGENIFNISITSEDYNNYPFNFSDL